MKYWLALVVLSFILVACQPQIFDCDDACKVQKAVDEKDPAICGLFSDTSKQMWCYNDVALAMRDSKVCANIFDDRAVAFCVSNVATQTDDLELCQAIEHNGARDACLYEMALARNDASLCGDILQKRRYGDTCAYDVAKVTRSPEDCLYIENVSTERRCLFFRASDALDQEACNSIAESQFWVDWCKVNVAITSLDTDLCTNIGNLTMVSQCKEIVKREISKS